MAFILVPVVFSLAPASLLIFDWEIFLILLFLFDRSLTLRSIVLIHYLVILR